VSHSQRSPVRRFDGLKSDGLPLDVLPVRRMVFHSLLVGLLVSGGVAVSWQGDVAAPPPSPSDGVPLFTPGPGSVGAAAILESPARIRDLGDSARRGWNDGGILELEALGPGKASVGTANSAALAGTEFEETDAPRRSPAGSPAGVARSTAGSAGTAGRADTPRKTDGSAFVSVVAGQGVDAAGQTTQRGSPTSDRWADRRADAAPAAPPTPAVAPVVADVGVDCGWLGLGCASRGVWMAMAGLGAAGCALAALIVREVYFGR